MATWKIVNWAKAFGQVEALRKLSFELKSNRIYGLVGPNGSGKSTFVKAITGLVKLDSGKLFRDDLELSITSPKQAWALGISAAHQDLSLVPNLSVKENLTLVAQHLASLRNTNSASLMQEFYDALDALQFPAPVSSQVGHLSRREQQIVEIAKAVGSRPSLLLLDEPTSFLTERDIERLFELLNQMRQQTTIIFVSHRLREIFGICDEVIIMRDGQALGTFNLRDISLNEVVKIMSGGASIAWEPARTEIAPSRGSEIPYFFVEVETRKINKISVTIQKGEILGIAGLVGHGQSEFLKAIYGLIPSRKRIEINGKPLDIGSPLQALRHGIVYISGTSSETILPHRSIKENISLIINGLKSGFSLVNAAAEKQLALTMVNNLGIVCRSVDEPLRHLSGGNQQKCVLARALSLEPKILLLDDPLKGIDTVTKAQFYKLIAEAAKNTAVLFYSSDVEELLPIASRVVVVFEGRIVGEFRGKEMTKENILAAALRGGNE
jgi:ABC-type sugar transport system ATPase subunit